MSDNHAAALAPVEPAPIDRAPKRQMSPFVAAGLAILEKQPNPEALRELMTMQREWEAAEAERAFTAAMINLKTALPSVIKRDATVKYDTRGGGEARYTHASLGHVMEEITQPLIDHGFALSWDPATTANGKVAVVCELRHIAGHVKRSKPIEAPPDKSGSKSDAQAVASTITLFERYTALALLGIATADMKDPTPDRGARSPGEDDENLPEDERVSSDRALRAVGLLKKAGRTQEQAVAFLGRNIEDWTVGDMERLTQWTKARKTEDPPEAA